MPITTPKVPDGLPELMKGLAKSVIKEKPENIYVHAAEYFENLIRERDGDLNEGYRSFSAQRVYADYREKCREKNGNLSSESAGEVASSSSGIQAQTISDNDESEGSAKAASKGKRRKRIRKQSSNKSIEKEEVPGSAESLKRTGSAKDPVISEDNVVKVHVHQESKIPQESAIGKMLSVDSEAAANAVSTVLGETVLDLDDADKETGEVVEPAPVETESIENQQHPINCEDLSSYPPDADGNKVEDFGSTPSTAEIVGEVVDLAEVPLEGAPRSGDVAKEAAETELVSQNVDDVDLLVIEDKSSENANVNGSAELLSDPVKHDDSGEDAVEAPDTVDTEVKLEPTEPKSSVEQMPDIPDVPDEMPVKFGSGEDAVEGLDTVDKEVNVDQIESRSSFEQIPDMPDVPDETAGVDVEPIVEELLENVVGNAEKGDENKSIDVDKNATEIQASEVESKEKVERLSLDMVNGNGEKIVEEAESIDEKVTEAPENDAKIADEQQSSKSIENSDLIVESDTEKASLQIKESPAAVPEKSAEFTLGEPKAGVEETTQKTKEEVSGSNADKSDSSQKDQTDAEAMTNKIKKLSEEDKDNSVNDLPDKPNENPSVPQEDESNTSVFIAEEKRSEAIEKPQPSTPAEDPVTSQAEQSNGPPGAIDASENRSPEKSVDQEDGLKSNGGSENASKDHSLERTESEINPSVDQSDGITDESSAKESGAEASAEAGNASFSSRMADDDEVGKVKSQEEEQGTGGDTDKVISLDISGEDLASEEPSAPPGKPGSDGNETEVAEDGTENDGSLQDAAKSSDKKSEGSLEAVEKAPNLQEATKATSSEDRSENGEAKKEPVVEEPCIQREVSPSTSKPESKNHSAELEEIKKVDLASFDANSAEALFYSLKKTELENDASPLKALSGDKNEDDDADVVVTEESPEPNRREQTKRSFTNDFLVEGPITESVTKPAEGDGVSADVVDEAFNPMVAATSRNQSLLNQMHSRDDAAILKSTQPRAPIRRSMTEKADLFRQDSNYVDLRKYDPDYAEDEDQFDGYYIGNIRNKILASSVSVADSDYYEPEHTEDLVDDNNVRTALETIVSTDTESTLASQITVQANRGFLHKTSSNIPYASFGNNAIDQSLDEFIEREELNKEAEAQAASKIQQSYRQFRSTKQKLLRDYQSTMGTFTEDQSTESLEDYSSVIQVKVDPKQATVGEDSVEAARSANNSRRPMNSLNIDEGDTVTRRLTLTRGTAVQKMSTREDDSGKSDKGSAGKKTSTSEPSTATDESPISSSTNTASDEKENKSNSSPKSRESEDAKPRPLSIGKKHSSPDAHQKLFIARQRTMPVQLDSSFIRMQPKHLRKRNKSAGVVRK
ncbi:treacle protein [Topomyia yanbarensis]|uniref:treacle protein n=1 Tax=Topomyia yanbarensis TaxID=2498891 RepID=UPI00273C7883|nr:treacle protein [Topomyia yanbarensis]